MSLFSTLSNKVFAPLGSWFLKTFITGENASDHSLITDPQKGQDLAAGAYGPTSVGTNIGEMIADNTQSPSTADSQDENQLDQLVNNIDWSQFGEYGDYLRMLTKASEIGLFSTAQDVADEAQRDRAFQAIEAQKERDWYENLSNTSFQRQVADLEAAGLNPILGWAHSGTGASASATAVPSGRATNLSSSAPNLADYLNAGANVVSSAADIVNAVAGIWNGKWKKALEAFKAFGKGSN